MAVSAESRRCDLGDDEEDDRLPLADAAHAVRALRVVAEGQVLAERQHRARARRLRDVHARRVHLVVEREAALLGHAAPLEVHRRPADAQQDLLVPALLEVDDALDEPAPPAAAAAGTRRPATLDVPVTSAPVSMSAQSAAAREGVRRARASERTTSACVEAARAARRWPGR